MSTKEKGALVFTHLRGEGASNIGRVMNDRGIRVNTINTPSYNLDEIDPLRPDVLVVMGGPMGVYQKDEYPYLKKEIEIIQKRLEADLPIIGVCLGSQLMATALGEEVYIGPQGREIGWFPLRVTPEGADTEARHFDGAKTQMFHWHGDTYKLPKGCTLLASSEAYKNQIYTYGKNALGLQCHPEVTSAQLEEWLVMFVGEVTGANAALPIEEFRRQTHANIDMLEKQTAIFFNEWLENRGL